MFCLSCVSHWDTQTPYRMEGASFGLMWGFSLNGYSTGPCLVAQIHYGSLFLTSPILAHRNLGQLPYAGLTVARWASLKVYSAGDKPGRLGAAYRLQWFQGLHLLHPQGPGTVGPESIPVSWPYIPNIAIGYQINPINPIFLKTMGCL